MDPLYALFAPLLALVNSQIRESTPARELCDKLDGRTIAVRVRDTALAVVVSVNAGRLDLTTVDECEPDAVITGSLLSLARLATPDGEKLIREGVVDFDGDALLANDFRALLRYARPDWEEQLSGVVGDMAAHSIGTAVRGLGQWGKQARSTAGQNLSEYLQEESRAVPSRYEVEAFRKKVQTLRDDVARCEARLAHLEAAAGSDE
ncbi:MAG: sterol-binding protein [Woeseia sp.]|nr:SCP2 sterol-binding domain-containing protein [Woeseia sp.]MBT8097841.1 SCP2 sterol-binding domain-containing protein [Woeseia sp.]NNE59881.1 sterol-binding protein [Woeseia sp.]NNL53712.1 sterol-binding protein [Woeseia sp.]